MAGIQPLTEIVGTGEYGTEGDHKVAYYTVACRECGRITQPETTIVQAGLQRQRHLAAHLKVLADEIAQASR